MTGPDRDATRAAARHYAAALLELGVAAVLQAEDVRQSQDMQAAFLALEEIEARLGDAKTALFQAGLATLPLRPEHRRDLEKVRF